MTDNTPKILSEHRAFGGTQRFLEHRSLEIGLPMRFSIYLPPQVAHERVPALLYLAGLTCNEETFAIKAGAQRMAASLGIALIAPDTSPRGAEVEGIPGAKDNWDFGIGAGFYLDALAEPWATHWRMEGWIVHELLPLVARHFAIDGERIGIFGHSMGGHGALTIALRHPERYRSVSAFAPIVAPSQVPWGRKALPKYLGEDRAAWADYDACELVHRQTFAGTILIDQGEADKFLEAQLKPELFDQACAEAGQPLLLRRHPGYDHSYWFISTFMEDHLRHHAKALGLL